MKDNSSSSIHGNDSVSEGYETVLSELGCDVYFIPPLQFDFCNIESLANRFRCPDKYSGVVLTSPRSVSACLEAFKLIEKKQDLMSWREQKLCYTVGPTTSMRVSQDLNWTSNNIRGGNKSGNSKSLGEYITKDFQDQVKYQETKQLLYPCGNLKRETLAEELSKNSNIQLDEVTCYNTNPNENLDSNLQRLMNETSHIDIVVFFSPSGVKNTWKLLQKYISIPSKYIAIGPTTLESLKSYCNDGDSLFESKSPSPNGIRDVVKQIIFNL